MKSSDGRFQYYSRDGEPLPSGSGLPDVHQIGYRCRRSDEWCVVNIRGKGHDVPKKSWILSGAVDAPTLTPSINCDGCWHGFIRDGKFYKTDQNTLEEKQ